MAHRAGINHASGVTRRGLLVLASLLALAAGSHAANAQDGQAAADDTPQQGGVLYYGEIAPEFSNVQIQRGGQLTVQTVLNALVDRLVAIDPDTLDLVPWIATDWTANDDFTQFTFTIRDGVTFSDGTILDAEAVRDNLDFLGRGNVSQGLPPSAYFVDYDRSEVTGPNQVTTWLKSPDNGFLRTLAGLTSGLVTPATLKLPKEQQSSLEHTVGSGPFVFESQVPDQEVTLKRRDDYRWAPAWSKNKGAAYLDKVVIKIIENISLRAGAVRSGDVDVARGILPSDENGLKNRGLQILVAKSADLTANFSAWRVQNPSVSDVRVRRALQKGVDVKKLTSAVLSDSYAPAASIVNRIAPHFHDFSGDVGYDPVEAERLLDEAGWTKGADGIRAKDGQQLVIVAAATGQAVSAKPGWDFIVHNLREIGVKVESHAGDAAFAAAANRDPEVETSTTRLLYYSGVGDLFSGNSSRTLSKDPHLEELTRRSRAARTAAEKDELERQIQKYILIDQALTLLLWDEVQVHAAAPGVYLDFNSATAPNFHGAWKVSNSN
ncbi:ABC transporter substrate-binding protein [Pseudochelatococcus sp. B33]